MASAPNTPSPRPREQARIDIARLGTPDHPLTLQRILAKACEIAAKTLDVERVGIWMIVDHGSSLFCVNLYEKSRDEHCEGVTLRVRDYPVYFESLRNFKALPIEIAQSDPRARELYETYMLPLGINSMLDAPIWQDGELFAIVCHEHIGPPREWTTEDRDFASAVADLLAIKFRSAEVTELQSVLHTHQQRLSDFERSEAMARLAVGVAHDFRNLLTIMGGGADLIAHRLDVPPEVTRWAQQISEAAERGAVLVRELLAFGRINGSMPRVVDPRVILEKFFPVLRAILGASHPCEIVQSQKPGFVLIDPLQVDRIFLNLVTNAKDAMPVSGKVTISIQSVMSSYEPDHSLRPYVLIEVADTGTGMDAATKQKIFEPFFTTKKKGTGLGMAIVKQVVEAAGGFIRIESQINVGTTVRVYLPRVTGER